MKKIITISAFLCAAASASEFSYTNFGVNYATGTADLPTYVTDEFGIGKGLDVEAVQAQARYEIAEGFYSYLNYERANIGFDDAGFGDLGYWSLTAGFGGYTSLMENLDLEYGGGYRYSKTKIYALDEDFDKQSLGHVVVHAGLRWSPASWIEVNPSLNYNLGVENDDLIEAVNGTYLNLNLYLTTFECVRPYIGGSLELQSSDDNLIGELGVFKAGVRFDF